MDNAISDGGAAVVITTTGASIQESSHMEYMPGLHQYYTTLLIKK